MAMQMVSMKDLRENFSRVKAAMEAGESLMLLYRSAPLAEIKPVRLKRRLRRFSTKQLKQWIVDDQLTPDEQRRIDALIKNLP